MEPGLVNRLRREIPRVKAIDQEVSELEAIYYRVFLEKIQVDAPG
jgi:hypothetical protein